MRGGHVQERTWRGRGVTVAGIGGCGAMVRRDAGMSDPLGENADGSRRGSSRVGSVCCPPYHVWLRARDAHAAHALKASPTDHQHHCHHPTPISPRGPAQARSGSFAVDYPRDFCPDVDTRLGQRLPPVDTYIYIYIYISSSLAGPTYMCIHI